MWTERHCFRTSQRIAALFLVMAMMVGMTEVMVGLTGLTVQLRQILRGLTGSQSIARLTHHQMIQVSVVQVFKLLQALAQPVPLRFLCKGVLA